MEATMKELSTSARALIDTVGDADGPTLQDRARVRRSLFGAVAGATSVSATALGAQAGASTAGAAAGAKLGVGTALAALSGKTLTTMQIALWLLAGSAAGVGVAGPVAWYVDRNEPVAVNQAPPLANAASLPLEPPPPIAEPRRTAPPAERVELGDPTASSNAALRSSKTAPRTAPKAAAEAPPDLAGEVALLQRAQRELSAGNASASLALLDDHGRRFPAGALTAERLASRVFALCELGQVEQARAAAREFFAVAAQSPLVPRVLSSCAGKSR